MDRPNGLAFARPNIVVLSSLYMGTNMICINVFLCGKLKSLTSYTQQFDDQQSTILVEACPGLGMPLTDQYPQSNCQYFN